jgi:hypothetical protein
MGASGWIRTRLRRDRLCENVESQPDAASLQPPRPNHTLLLCTAQIQPALILRKVMRRGPLGGNGG